MTFKEKLVKLRKLKGITQDEFASAVGVSRQAVYKWESGQSYPEVSKLLEMKALFGISIDDLLDDNYEVIVPEKKKKRLSPSVKKKIEQKVEAEEYAKAEAAEPVITEEIKEAEPVLVKVVSESVSEIKEEVISDGTLAAANISQTKEEPKERETWTAAQTISEKESEKYSEKKGFFSKFFGRK